MLIARLDIYCLHGDPDADAGLVLSRNALEPSDV